MSTDMKVSDSKHARARILPPLSVQPTMEGYLTNNGGVPDQQWRGT